MMMYTYGFLHVSSQCSLTLVGWQLDVHVLKTKRINMGGTMFYDIEGLNM